MNDYDVLFVDCGSVPHVARMSGGGQLHGGARIPAGTLAAAWGGDPHQPIPGRPFRPRSPRLSWETLCGAGATPRPGQGHCSQSFTYTYIFFCFPENSSGVDGRGRNKKVS